MDAITKKCPLCTEEIKTEAKVCRFCGAMFEVTVAGYCAQCHKVVNLNSEGKCSVCNGQIIDQHIESKYTGERAARPMPVRSAPAVTPAAAVPARPAVSQPGDNITRIRQWCDHQKGRPIKLNVVSKLGEGWDTVTSAHGELVAIEEHPTQKGIFRMEFDSRLQGIKNDAVMLGFEVRSVTEQGDQLIIDKGPNQRFELIAGVEPAKVPPPPKPPKVDWPEIPGYAVQQCRLCEGVGSYLSKDEIHECTRCEGKGGFLVQQPARPCPTCQGRGRIPYQEIYTRTCDDCKETGWQGALTYSAAGAQV